MGWRQFGSEEGSTQRSAKDACCCYLMSATFLHQVGILSEEVPQLPLVINFSPSYSQKVYANEVQI